MEKVPGKRIGSCLFRDINSGHLYRCSYTKQQKMYMKCCKKGCNGSGILFKQSNCFQRRNCHIHDPDDQEYAVRKLMSQVKERSEKEDLPYETIFEEEAQKLGGTPVEFKSIKRTMERYRSKSNPIPKPPKVRVQLVTVQADGTLIVSDRAECLHYPRRRFKKKKPNPSLEPNADPDANQDAVQELDDSVYTHNNNEALAALQTEMGLSLEEASAVLPDAPAATTAHQDKWDIFAKFVACEIRSLGQEHLQSELKKKIMAIIMEFN